MFIDNSFLAVDVEVAVMQTFFSALFDRDKILSTFNISCWATLDFALKEGKRMSVSTIVDFALKGVKRGMRVFYEMWMKMQFDDIDL